MYIRNVLKLYHMYELYLKSVCGPPGVVQQQLLLHCVFVFLKYPVSVMYLWKGTPYPGRRLTSIKQLNPCGTLNINILILFRPRGDQFNCKYLIKCSTGKVPLTYLYKYNSVCTLLNKYFCLRLYYVVLKSVVYDMLVCVKEFYLV